jgi:hypothetical protein
MAVRKTIPGETKMASHPAAPYNDERGLERIVFFSDDEYREDAGET